MNQELLLVLADELHKEAMETMPPKYKAFCLSAMLESFALSGRLEDARATERWVQERWVKKFGSVPCIGDIYPCLARLVVTYG